MSQLPSGCREIQADLLAVAVKEAEPEARQRVKVHVARCAPCRGEFERYHAIDEALGELRSEPPAAADLAQARAELEVRLADLRSRLVNYQVFPSPLGRILIAQSEQGVLLVRFLGRQPTIAPGRLSREGGFEAVADGGEMERLYQELVEYLQGKRTRLEWPIDLRMARSDFHRTVLQVTSQIPYGSVISYAGVAREVGKPAAVRAVAQALRWNPVPIAIPCHRVIGASGSLTGYAGNKIELKQRLLAVEGVPTLRRDRDFRVVRDAMYVTRPGKDHYCLPTCGSLPSLSLARLILFASRERAEGAGLRPCRTCGPDLHPISQ